MAAKRPRGSRWGPRRETREAWLPPRSGFSPLPCRQHPLASEAARYRLRELWFPMYFHLQIGREAGLLPRSGFSRAAAAALFRPSLAGDPPRQVRQLGNTLSPAKRRGVVCVNYGFPFISLCRSAAKRACCRVATSAAQRLRPPSAPPLQATLLAIVAA